MTLHGQEFEDTKGVIRIPKRIKDRKLLKEKEQKDKHRSTKHYT